MRCKGRPGLLLITSLVCAVGLSLAGLGSALGDTTNPDGSHTATATIPVPPGVPCPMTFNGTTSISPGLAVVIPSASTIVSHLLSLNCPGSTVTESFDPNASSPAPGPGDRTVRDDFSVKCVQGGGCAGGSVPASLDVTYTVPGTSSGSPPDSHSLVLGVYAFFRGHNRNSSMLATLATGQPDLDLLEGAVMWRAKRHKAKPLRIGSIPDTHIPAGTQTIRIPVRLTSRGERFLDLLGKLKVTVTGKLESRFGIYQVQSNGTYKRIG